MLHLYGFQSSGNCYKPRLLMEQLNIAYDWHDVDLLNGATKSDAFLQKTAFGKVPVLELEDGRILSESNAMLCYLAENTAFTPEDRFAKAQVLQWLFWEQYSHEPVIAVARFVNLFLDADHPRKASLPDLRQKAAGALEVMDKHLSTHEFFVNNCYSIADIALFAYTHVSNEAGIDLDPYEHIRRWITAVQSTPRFVPMLE